MSDACSARWAARGAAARAIAAGASPDDLVRAMTAASYEAVFRLLFILSAEHAEEGKRGADRLADRRSRPR